MRCISLDLGDTLNKEVHFHTHDRVNYTLGTGSWRQDAEGLTWLPPRWIAGSAGRGVRLLVRWAHLTPIDRSFLTVALFSLRNNEADESGRYRVESAHLRRPLSRTSSCEAQSDPPNPLGSSARTWDGKVCLHSKPPGARGGCLWVAETWSRSSPHCSRGKRPQPGADD